MQEVRLIDAAALVKEICNNGTENNCTCYPKCYPCDFSEARRLIEEQPTVDAEPVVRCGECKYMQLCGKCTMFADDRIRPSVSDFCSYGEREEEEGGAEE